MPLVIVGVLLLVAKLAEFGPFAHWSWWIVLAPFALAALWWQFADTTGLTQRRAMDKMEQRKADRRNKAMAALGLSRRRERQRTQATQEKARLVSADPTQQTDTAPPSDFQRHDPRL
jgi:small Trp-rich protein